MLPWQVPQRCQKFVNITQPWIWVPPKPVNNRRCYWGFRLYFCGACTLINAVGRVVPAG